MAFIASPRLARYARVLDDDLDTSQSDPITALKNRTERRGANPLVGRGSPSYCRPTCAAPHAPYIIARSLSPRAHQATAPQAHVRSKAQLKCPASSINFGPPPHGKESDCKNGANYVQCCLRPLLNLIIEEKIDTTFLINHRMSLEKTLEVTSCFTTSKIRRPRSC